MIELRNITKRFGEVLANDRISITVTPGTIHAIVGENGAGKSTVMRIAYGFYTADSGEILINGEVRAIRTPHDAIALGIGMVHQHFMLVEPMTVAENIVLGSEPGSAASLDLKTAAAEIRKLSDEFKLAVDPNATVESLSVGQQQRVELLKALYRQAKLLILDEPTAVLTPQESESLFATLQRLVADGLSLIFISHKLPEVLRVSDRIAVLRNGKLVATVRAADADRATLAHLMVGRDVPMPVARPRSPAGVVCELADVSIRGELDGVSLVLRGGEITAIAGVSGNGQQALADVLFGLRAPESGSVRIAGRALDADPQAWVKAGVARVPEDRQAVGLIGELPLWENAIAERYRTRFARGALVRRHAAHRYARDVVARFDVRSAGGIDTPARSLSGGNMQKLILGRALATDLADEPPPVFIVADQPTWGLDIGAVAFVHQQLLDACGRGAAVLLISDDLDEIYALADRIAVIHAGRLTEARPTSEWDLATIGLAMAGGMTTPTLTPRLCSLPPEGAQ